MNTKLKAMINKKYLALSSKDFKESVLDDLKVVESEHQ